MTFLSPFIILIATEIKKPMKTKKYIVQIKEVHNLAVPVEASSENEARKIVNDWLASQDDKIPFDELTYSHTMPSCDWTVESAN